jgi:arginine/ornithine transport system permease protein
MPWSAMRVDLVLLNWQLFATGVWITLQLTALALMIGFAIALPAGLARARRLRGLSPAIYGYVYLFRGTPLLVQLFLIYYGLAQFEFIRTSWAWTFLRDPWWCALIAFGLNSGAYTTEIIRGAVETTPPGELEAATALGLSDRQRDWLVLVPSALRRALPQYGNEVVFMLHGSVVASVIALQDILGAGRTLNARYYLAYEGFLTAAALYMVMAASYLMVARSSRPSQSMAVPSREFVFQTPVAFVVTSALAAA